MTDHVFRSFRLFCLCGAVSLAVPVSVRAEEYKIPEIGVKTSTALVAKIQAPDSHIYIKPQLESTTVADVDQARPGDLVFYATGGHIDHVALYMGNGLIVHASAEKTGIKVSQWDSRKPVKVVDVIN